ncbi:LytR family transcriptional regulator [Streptomyces abyssalis]|uniref:LytR family transcriptional regulator n=1 Tax=Streptomyces abyssalis TaxID=933944 RepID=A0A1E7JM86_9ACTN|nr:LCP family protein [Streptomyces abyssalis]OEU87125.1 LytR family transcriptional regulator [Streptomyces abyssalis]OEU88985.1 LytR family transcriptional regulator [Streptomyces abyssalis]
MNAQGRGHAGDVDPADQWVFDPSTGSYKLQLNSEAGDSRSPSAGSRPDAPRQRRASTAEEAEPRLPSQRRRGGRSQPPPPAAGHGRRKRKPGPSKKQKVLRWGAGTLGLILVAGGITGYFLYEHFNGNISKVDVGKDNAAVTDGPVNILVLGTDSRKGKGNGGYGDAASVGHADTTFLFHVSEDRTNATALSIPRDMITDIPACPTKQEDGSEKIIPGQTGVRFNTSLGQSGRDPGCTWRTVEKMTGLKINHFMMADFNAVKQLSSAVGGVEVCTAKPIKDPKSHLNLTAGKHTVKGEQALAFVRTRKSVGFGSDLDRIKLQQQFLSSMIRKMKSGDTLSNPSKLFDLANAMTKALTVDTGIGTVGKLTDLAKDLQRVNVKNITFATVPVVDNPEDPATVVLDEAKAKPLFKMVQADKSLTKTKKGSEGKDPSKAKKVPASQVRVDVRNGGGPVGAAQQTVDWLQNNKGVGLSTNAGNAPSQLSRTRLEFSSSQAGQAATLAEMMGLPKSALKQSSSVGKSMELTLAKDFTAAGEPVAAPEKAPDGVQNVKANDKKVCAK